MKHIVFSFPTGITLGGSNIWSLYMLRHLAAKGIPVTAVVHRNTNWHPPLDLAWPDGVGRICSGGAEGPKAGVLSRFWYRRAYSSLAPAIFIPNFSDAVYKVCSGIGRTPEQSKIICVLHGDGPGYYVPAIAHEKGIAKYIAVNSRIGRTIREALPHREHDVVVRSCPVECPVKLDRFNRDPASVLRLTYAGRITNFEKRVGQLPVLADKLHRRGVRFLLRIIGEGGYKEWLKHEVAQLPAQARASVSIESARSPFEMAAVWKETDVGILVSDCEGTPLSMLEAMAHGCAVVVPRLEGIEAVLHEGLTGLMYPVNDISSMAECIANLASDFVGRKRMGEAAHKIIKSDYSYETYVQWFLNFVGHPG